MAAKKVAPRTFIVAFTSLDSYPIGTLVREDIELANMDVKRLLRIGAIDFVSVEQADEYGKTDAATDFDLGGEQDQEPEA